MAAPPAPIITLPNNGINFSTNISVQTISGTTDVATHEIRINGSPAGVVYTPGNTVWSFPDTTLSKGENVYSVTALNISSEESPSDVIKITLLEDSDLNLVVSPPTGVFTESKKDSVTTFWVQNPEPQVIGYNIYGSTDPGGGSAGYTQLNVDLISAPTKTQENIVVISEDVEEAGNIRRTVTTERVDTRIYYAFTQTLDPGTGEKLQQGVRRYFVVTAVGYDPVLREEVESVYSGEISGLPQFIDTSLRDLTPRTEFDVLTAQISRILEVNDEIDIKPGTVVRDVFLDPSSAEFARLYIVEDFAHRAQSFLTLVAFDDSNNDGISDLVDESPQKQALRDALFLDDAGVQQLIDEAFTKLAGNFNVERKGATNAAGELTIYTLSATPPTKDIVVSKGALFSTTADPDTNTPAFVYEALAEARIRVSTLDLFFNSSNNRYEVKVQIRAQTAGTDANVSANKIINVISGVNQPVGVTNELALSFGTDQESNVSLATRGMLAFVSLDTGTIGGYLAESLKVPNVTRAKVIDAGNPFMERDWDEVRLKHIGGKVDVYIQGEIINEITETIAFQYPQIIDEIASVENVPMFQFRVLNPAVTVNTPIFEVTKVRNLTRLNDYVLTGYSVVDGTIIDLDETNATNIAIGLDSLDSVEVTYKYIPQLIHKFKLQPIIEVTDVVGDLSGDLNSNYNAYREEDPLWWGDSTIASDSIEIFNYNGKPLNQLQSTTEDVVLPGEEEVALSKVGIIDSTIVVKDQARVTTYVLNADYAIISGDYETPSKIKRLANGSISSSELVEISYQSGENIQIKYLYNLLIDQVQQQMEIIRHTTADVLAKTAQRGAVTVEATVVIDAAADEEVVDNQIRTRTTRYLDNSVIGSAIYQGDIIAIIENTPGVIHTVLTPGISKMIRADDSRIFRESVSPVWQFFYLDHVNVYITSTNVLDFKTIDGGGRKVQIGSGPGYIFRHVRIYEDSEELTMVNEEAKVGRAAGQGFIKGDGRLLVSTTDGANPSSHSYTVTYYVFGETGAYDVAAADLEYLDLEELNITLRPETT